MGEAYIVVNNYPGRLNVNGGAITPGHPLGAFGIRLMTTHDPCAACSWKALWDADDARRWWHCEWNSRSRYFSFGMVAERDAFFLVRSVAQQCKLSRTHTGCVFDHGDYAPRIKQDLNHDS